MFSFIKKIEIENIPVVRALFTGLTKAFTYILLLWLIYIVNFSWIVVPLAFLGVMSSVFVSLFEDIQTLKHGKYKMKKITYFFSFLNLVVFWFLIFYLCSNIELTNFTVGLVYTSAVLAFVTTLATSFMIPSLMNSIKATSNIHEKYKDQKSPPSELIKELEDESKRIKKEVSKAIIFTFFPSILSVVFLWWAFYRIFVQMNVSVEVIVYVIFVILFEMILSNFTKTLKKELINKTIENNYE